MKNQQLPKPLLPKYIRSLRRERELTQLEVAQYLGISQSQYSLFEQGHVVLPEAQLDRLSKLLGPSSAAVGGRSGV